MELKANYEGLLKRGKKKTVVHATEYVYIPQRKSACQHYVPPLLECMHVLILTESGRQQPSHVPSCPVLGIEILKSCRLRLPSTVATSKWQIHPQTGYKSSGNGAPTNEAKLSHYLPQGTFPGFPEEALTCMPAHTLCCGTCHKQDFILICVAFSVSCHLRRSQMQ